MIFAIKPFEIHDGDGIRTTVFFKGCPLRCKWCHNPESFSFQKQILFDAEQCAHCMQCTLLCDANLSVQGKHAFDRKNCTLCEKCIEVCPQRAFEVSGITRSPEEIAEEVLKDEIFMKGSGGGVTFSGGEPLMQIDLCVEIAKLLKKRDIHIAIDTCAYVPKESIDQILPYADAFLMDIKAIDEDVHIACTGVSNQQILANIQYVDSLGIPIEIRYPYVPTMNDKEADKIADFVKQCKHVTGLKILPYHSYADRKYKLLNLAYPLPQVPLPSKEEIEQVAKRMRERGVANIVPM